MKNYIGFVNDHSGSMRHLAMAAAKDYNENIASVKQAASAEMLDTVVSVVGVGFGDSGQGTERQVQISNPHVLKPITSWSTIGGTPLYDGIADMINLLKDLPDAGNPDVSFLVMITTDGDEQHSKKYDSLKLSKLIQEVSASGRWTFVFRLPAGRPTTKIDVLGIPAGNIQRWETTAKGMADSTVVNAQAMGSYFRSRSLGAKSTGSFYADASKVNLAALEEITSKVSLYVVPMEDNGIEIRPFILRHRMEYLKGAAFYQLSKTEAKVGYQKQILVREQTTGKIFTGASARQMIGLPTDRNARLHPGDHKNYDIFIQSESVNRKLVGGSGVIYWKEIGVPFTDADLAYLQPKNPAPTTPAPVQLLKVPVSTTPTKSPIPVKPREDFFMCTTRESARRKAAEFGVVQSRIQKRPGHPTHKWAVPTK